MHHCYEPIMQRLITLQIEYKTLLRAGDLFKDLERPDLVIGDEEYAELMEMIDEACKNMRMVAEELGKVAWEKVEMRKVGVQLAKVVMKEVEKRKVGEEIAKVGERLRKVATEDLERMDRKGKGCKNGKQNGVKDAEGKEGADGDGDPEVDEDADGGVPF